MKIAIVGSGISGLACAYHLAKSHDVHVFEAAPHIGGHTNTIDVPSSHGQQAVDTGFIVFNERTYPRFIHLLNTLSVSSQRSSMSFSVKSDATGLEYNGTNLNSLFAQRTNLFRPAFYRMIKDILRFNKESINLLNDQESAPDLSLGDYLSHNNYSDEFIHHYIVPMGAAIWSSGARQMRNFPVRYFVRFFKNHGMLSVNDRPEWRVIKGGSRAYIPALTKTFSNHLHTSTPVRAIRRFENNVSVSIEQEGKLNQSTFDHVVLAGHADQMLPLLTDATPLERDILSSFTYQENPTILHTDTTVLPKRRLAWAAWNYLIPAKPQDRVAVTYNMNILQSLNTSETFLVSLNMDSFIDPSKVIKKILYHHPVYTSKAVAAQQRWAEISGPARTHFCGAYWGYGFHEDGVKSGERVSECLGAKIT